jgi:hypothetical protein
MPALPARPTALTKPRLLIGEGVEEVLFFDALLGYLNIDDIQVEQYGGKDNLSRYLREFPNRPGYERVVALGITRDADTDCADTFSRIGGALAASGFPVPPACGQVTPGLLRVGVFVLPDNSRPGMLEDLCMDAVVSDPVLPCLEEYFRCVQAAGRHPQSMAKARVHAWLASQIEPDRRLGEAARSGYWPWGHPAFDPLRQFLHML